MYSKYSPEELRSLCKAHIENFEMWARRFIHEILTKGMGADYIHCTDGKGNHKFRQELIDHVDEWMKQNPQQYSEPMDTTYISDAISILCRQDIYKAYFSKYLSKKFPGGSSGLREVLNRLTPIRNKLSHATPISIREVEQCVCYCNDFIDCVKEYYRMTNQEKEFNVPTIIGISDSLGNKYQVKEFERTGSISVTIMDPTSGKAKVFHFGDKFGLNLTVDPSFDKDSYKINWFKKDGLETFDNGKRITVRITNSLVGQEVMLTGELITNSEWHRFPIGYDQKIYVHFKALPPF